MKFQTIDQYREEFDVVVRCEVRAVSRSGYSGWRDRSESKRSVRQHELIGRIREIHEASHDRYGSPRVHAELMEQKIDLCVNSVARYMKIPGIMAKTKRRFKVKTADSHHDLPVFENRLDRTFVADTINRTWLCDITYVPTDEGFLYLAAVPYTCSQKIVGWSLSDSLATKLCSDALKMAIANRTNRNSNGLAGLWHHSDRGSQQASKEYQSLLAAWKIDACIIFTRTPFVGKVRVHLFELSDSLSHPPAACQMLLNTSAAFCPPRL